MDDGSFPEFPNTKNSGFLALPGKLPAILYPFSLVAITLALLTACGGGGGGGGAGDTTPNGDTPPYRKPRPY